MMDGDRLLQIRPIPLARRITMTLVSVFQSLYYELYVHISLCFSTSKGGWGSSATASTWTPTSDLKIEEQKPSIAAIKQETIAPSSTTNSSNSMSLSQVKRENTKMEADDGEETAVWFMERVCIQVKGDGTSAVIKEIDNKTAVVELEDKSTRSVRASEVSMVPPKEHDTVLVTGGADVGVEGELVCIDGTDAILKDANEDFKIVDFVHLAKIVGDT